MRAHNSELAVDPREGLAPRRLEPADCFCWATLLGAVLLAMTGAVPAVLFLAVTLMALLVLRQLDLPVRFELGFAIGIVLQGWGNALPLFERIGWYDKAVHFLTPLLVVPSLYLLLARAGAVPDHAHNGLRREIAGIVLVTVAFGVSLATFWELVEGSADRWLGTSFAHGYLETIDDLYCSVLGSIAAGVVLGWSAVAPTRGPESDGIAHQRSPEPE